MRLIQKTIDVKEIENKYPTVSVDEKYISVLKRSTPKTIGGAIDVLANIQHEVRTHPTSPFFIDLRREVEKTYEELRTRKLKTEEAMKKLLSMSERIAKWKKEEKEIGRNKYPLYEALKTVIPELEKEKAINFIDNLLAHLKERKLLFKGWQLQREVRRKIKAEIRFLSLINFKKKKSKIDDLVDSMFQALEEIK